MGWVKKDGKPIIYNYEGGIDNGSYSEASPSYFTWQTGHYWNLNHSEAIKFKNDTKVPLKISHIGIKTVSCHSGGKGYWAAGGYMEAPGCTGKGGTYTSFVRVSNDGEKTFERCTVISGKNEITVPNITSSNMNSAGTSGSDTAKFGDPPYTGNKALSYKNFEISDCPIIEPGGVAYIHIKVDTDNSRSVVVRFVLDTDELDIAFEPGTAPYIWRYCEDGKWYLRKPLYVSKNGKWNDPEGD